MGNRTWTDSQQDAIQARRGTLLVSAAAGSGKTAVLVQRVIERMTDPVSPTDADRLLVVTFTKAAAAEMRERIGDRLTQLLEENPSDWNLQRQQMLLHRASISTVHSFCSDLVRENFYKLGISPDFRILDESERTLLRNQAVTQVMEHAYEEADPAFADLLEAFGADRSDDRLMQTICRLYDFIRSHPFPQKWLDEKEAMYRQDRPIGETAWGKVVLDYAKGAVQYSRSLIEGAMRQLAEDGTLSEAYSPAFSSDLAGLDHLRSILEQGEWDAIVRAMDGMEFIRMKSVRGYKDDPLKLRVCGFRDEAKDTIKKLRGLFSMSEADCEADRLQLAPLVHMLFTLTSRFSTTLDQWKAQRKAADFGDLEHWALRLLLEESEEGEQIRTEEAKQLAERFDEVMVDEYQDTNEAQDMLFRAISREEGNLFMVGDVKQSIYSFRQAMPRIFLERRHAFPVYDRLRDAYPAHLVLDKNFRSRRTVTDAVNFVFRQLMSQQAGDVDYEGQEELVAGASYPEQSGCETCLDILNLDAVADETQDETMSVLEARHMGQVIARMIKEGFLVQEGGGQRPVAYRDFCILLRSANKHAPDYARELQLNGIPAWADTASGFFETIEIAVMLSFLRILDNPMQDIPLLAVLMSPIYGFTPDQLADIRLEGRKLPLYLALQQHAKNGDRQALAFLRDLEQYRALAATMPSDRILELLYQKTGYRNLVQTMENGEGRLANLHLLQEYAKKFEDSGYNGLSRFIRFLDQLQQQKADLPSASSLSESANVVKIMSIHRSKGLEFPICMVAGCGRRFNKEKSEALLHPQLGLGVKLRDSDTLCRYTTLPREAIALEMDREAMSEELRILYVAMTRAREKLILVTSVKNLESRLAALAAELTDQPKIEPYVVNHASSISDWLLSCALRHPDGQNLRELALASEDIVQRTAATGWDIHVVLPPSAWETDGEERAEEPAEPDPVLLGQFKQALSYVYPHQAVCGLPAKVTASALAGEEHRELTGEPILPRPTFFYSNGLTPAERGTALHAFLQFANYAQAGQNVEKELDRLEGQGFLTKDQAQAVDRKRVEQFFQSPVARRMLASSNLVREFRFTVEIPAARVRDGEGLADQTVILQGAVDCAFEEEGALIIVDYKTDRIQQEEELWARYEPQLSLYAMAMEQCTGKQVREYLLYSFHLGREVRGEMSKLLHKN